MSKNIKVLICSFCAFFISLAAVSVVIAQQSPAADAGDNLYLDSGDKATLHGSGEDPDGDSIAYSWDCSIGTLSAANIAEPQYTAPNIIAFDNRDIATCTLTVKDEAGFSNSDTIKIYINYDDKEDVIDIDVKTKSTTDVSKNTATLNGYFETENDSAKYAWFEYGFSKNYKNKTDKQRISNNSDYFSQQISQLFLNGTYHYRAVVEDDDGHIFHGQDMIFTTDSNYHRISGSSEESGLNFSVTKKIMNLTTGQSIWADSISANPNDVICFSITVTAKEDLTNLVIKENLPATLIYSGNLSVNSVKNYYDSLISGINIGSLNQGQSATFSYQAKVAPASSFPYGASAISTTTVISSDQQNDNATNGAIFFSVIVNNSNVAGASTISGNPTEISTGLTNNFWKDSSLLPLLVIAFSLWFYFSGNAYKFADWLKSRIKN